MNIEFGHHKTEYFVLFSYTLLSLALLLGYQEKQPRLILISLYIGFYFCWSIIHQLINRNLTWVVFLEHVLITGLALITLKVLFFPNL